LLSYLDRSYQPTSTLYLDQFSNDDEASRKAFLELFQVSYPNTDEHPLIAFKIPRHIKCQKDLTLSEKLGFVLGLLLYFTNF
jgi:hypothetical protein